MEVFPDEVQAKESWPVNSFADGRKLLVGEEVEVLCANEESFNSWIKGVVIDCQNYCRVAKLDNMLHEEVWTRIVEPIPVSEAIEGKLSMIEGTHRSRIRPFPPQLKLQTSKLSYGLCVDAFTGSWREGVVVDQKHHSAAKLIFFPDRCDECWVPSHQLRLTQEWDEISGNWRRRGKWLFFQIIKEMYKGKTALPELRQIWFQLKSVVEFRENIKLWYSGSKFMWRGLVSDVIEGKWPPVISSTATQPSTDVVVTDKCFIETEGTSSNV